MKELWIVGQVKDWPHYEFQGVFDTEEKAIAACRGPEYFVSPEILNAELPHETELNPRAYYPHHREIEMEPKMAAKTWKDAFENAQFLWRSVATGEVYRLNQCLAGNGGTHLVLVSRYKAIMVDWAEINKRWESAE